MAVQYANMTTTSEIEGWEIQSYLGAVSSHLVAGTGLFSDFAAGSVPHVSWPPLAERPGTKTKSPPRLGGDF